jgi:hypothetical protein
MADAGDPGILHLDTVHPEWFGMQSMCYHRTHHPGMGDKQDMLAAMADDNFFERLGDAGNEATEWFSTGRAAVDRIVIERLELCKAFTPEVIGSLAFPFTEADFLQAIIDLDLQVVFFSEGLGKIAAALQG